MTHTIHHIDVDRSGWTETFLTVPLAEPVADARAAQGVFAEVAAFLVDRGIEVLQEKVYGPASEMDALLEARQAAYSACGVSVAPATFLDGRPCIGGVFAGVQIIGAVSSTPDVVCRTVEHGGEAVGRLLETPTYRTLYLAGVSGRSDRPDDTVTAQGGRMFAVASELLEAQGFTTDDIVRTWIYLPRLLDWYGEFNRVRTATFRQWGLIKEDGTGILPASTGIQCRRHVGEECFMDVFAMARRDGGREGIEPMRNTRQNEAYEYGSSFSRGMSVSLDGPTVHYVSGTASINPLGETVYHGDHQGQLVETLFDIHALLRNSGAAFKDVCQAVAYCKGEEDYKQFRRFLDLMDWADMPAIPVYADVCRDELLFEMDAIAVGP